MSVSRLSSSQPTDVGGRGTPGPALAEAPPKTSRARQTTESLARLGLPPDALPHHIAVIMDGNGRWARLRNRPRIYGHEQGAKAVRAVVTECARLELDALTLYSFSTENWSRPADEIDFLMDLYVAYLRAERPTMMENDVRFVQIGQRRRLPERGRRGHRGPVSGPWNEK